MKLDTARIEAKWKQRWAETGLYAVREDASKPKYYVLDMFPYPSGAGLHVGHPLGYVASDIFSRYKRMKGFNVLHPMGYDAFGLPAEQYALDTGVHPAASTSANIERYRAQLDNIGFCYDWSRAVRTDDPRYYQWTQWIFLQLYGHYYDRRAGKARPIAVLEAAFAASGSEGVDAACTPHKPFTAAEWQAMDVRARHTMLMHYRLAYRTVGYVNWCEALGTVLANDEVKDGVSERGGFPVVQKEMLQWSLRITAYAERLLQGMDGLEWNESLKAIQRNWIGRSEGAYIDFAIEGQDSLAIKVYTTRPDTIFGVSFLVLAPDHELVAHIAAPERREQLDAFARRVRERAGADRGTQKISEGFWTGAMAVHPLTGETVPVWTADYVLKDYGTGAIMAVPDDDTRDRAFALANALPVPSIIDRSGIPGAEMEDRQGVMVNSGFLNGMKVDEALAAMLDHLEQKGLGTRSVQYKLRDANFSRQRYWGEPFPITYTDDGIESPLAESDLPLVLPDLDDFKPSPDGRSPLARLTAWTHPTPGVTRETDTMPGYAGSSWYFLRYMDPHNADAFASKEAIAYWQDVDLYVGGIEHAVGHLMYSRFWHKFLYDIGLVPTQEPFRKLINQGMIQGVIEYALLRKEKTDGRPHFISRDVAQQQGIPIDSLARIPVHIDFVSAYGQSNAHLTAEGLAGFTRWRPEYADAIFECATGRVTGPTFGDAMFHTLSEVGKMSKRYHNVVNPDDVIARYGADVFRMYEMFLGPIEQSKPWDTMGIEGISKFIKKCWSMFVDEQGEWAVRADAPTEASQRILNATIRKVADDIERFSFNTAISQLMICVNELRRQEERSAEVLDPFVRLLAPFAPFLAEELWENLGHADSVHLAGFPVHDERWLVVSAVNYPVCINGKKRAEIELAVGLSNDEIEAQVKALPEVAKWTEGKPLRKVIIVPQKMINLVV